MIIRAEGLGRVFGSGETAVAAVVDASFEVAAGELVVLRGPSGSGKTTLLTMLGGLDRPTTGRVLLGDRDLTAMTEDELAAMTLTVQVIASRADLSVAASAALSGR